MSEVLLSVIFPWLLLLFLFVAGVVLVAKTPAGIRALRRMPLAATLTLIIAIALGAYLRFAHVPLDHRIYFDEDRYLSYAVTFARFGKSVSVDMASPQKSFIGVPDDAVRLTVPVLHAIILKTVGFSEANLFNGAKVFSVIQIILVFAVAHLLTKRAFVASFAAFGMAILPTVVYWSVSIGLDGYFVFFSLLAVLAALLFAHSSSHANTTLLASSVFVLLGVRLESFLMLPIIMGAIILARNARKVPAISRSDIPVALTLLVLIGIRAAASISVLGKKWCCAEALPLEAFSQTYMVRNILPNMLALFGRAEFPFVLTLLAGYALLTRPNVTQKILIFSWMAFYFFIYSFYYAGVFFTPEFSGSYGRYFLMLIPPLLILAGLGASEIISNLHNNNKRLLLSLLLIIFTLTLYPTANNYIQMITTSPSDRLVELGPRQVHQYLEHTVIPKTPQNAVIIHNLTAYVLLTGRTVVFSGSFRTEPQAVDFVIDSLKKGTPVYVVSTAQYECELLPERCKLTSNLIEYKEVLPTSETNPGLSQLVLKPNAVDNKDK